MCNKVRLKHGTLQRCLKLRVYLFISCVSMAVEWRSGLAGHLILSDEDVTSVVQGTWKRLNTLQHYKVRTQSAIALSIPSSSPRCPALLVALAPAGSLLKSWSFLSAAYSN